MRELRPESFFDLNNSTLSGLFENVEYVWDVLDRIEGFITNSIQPNVASIRRDGDVTSRTYVLWRDELLTTGFELRPGDATKGKFQAMRGGEVLDEAAVIYPGVSLMDDRIEIRPGAVVEPGALLKGPTIIGPRTEVRQGAYVRGSCLTGRGCVVGHATELKNAVMLDGAKAGHFAYLGDSVLGAEVNLGAGTKLANLKMIASAIKIKIGDRTIEVDRRKFGAILGDGVETGCNSVTNPGTVLGPKCLVTPCKAVKAGYYKPRSVIRQTGGEVCRLSPADRDIHTMLLRVRPLLGVHPEIMRDYLFYRSEIEFQLDRLDAAERKALDRFDRFLRKYRLWIVAEVYTPELLSEAVDQFGPDHWWWWMDAEN